MKTKFFVATMLFFLTFISCKKDGAAANGEEIKNFRVDLNVYAEKNDNFALYYTENNSTNFDTKRVVWAGVKGKKDQKITMDLSPDVTPSDIRLDFGLKLGEEQGDVTLKNFKLNYHGHTFEGKGSDFLKYFIKNDSIQTNIDAAKGTITFRKNPKSKMTPFYYPQQTILEEIKKITK